MANAVEYHKRAAVPYVGPRFADAARDCEVSWDTYCFPPKLVGQAQQKVDRVQREDPTDLMGGPKSVSTEHPVLYMHCCVHRSSYGPPVEEGEGE